MALQAGGGFACSGAMPRAVGWAAWSTGMRPMNRGVTKTPMSLDQMILWIVLDCFGLLFG